jgi:thiol-disulfide isomerase/thioredoxin
MKHIISLLLLLSLSAKAQTGYDLKINFKGCKDSTVYLVVHLWESNNIVDSCKNIKNGQIRFKGKTNLQKGLYILVNQAKNTSYFEFFINESQKFGINLDNSDITRSLTSLGNKENEQFFAFNKFFVDKNMEFESALKQQKGKSKEDSTKAMADKIKQLNEDVKKFDTDFRQKNQGTFLIDYFNLKFEKQATDIPKASNGRPDSLYQYYYYKSHYWDDVNFKDDRLIHTPLFDDRIKKYFDQVIVQHPDTIIKEIDKILGKCDEKTLIYKMLLGHFTYKYEQSKKMSFDKNSNSITDEKIFIHLAEKYIVAGHAEGVYSDETVKAIQQKVVRSKPLLPGSKAPDIFVIDTIHAKEVIKMGFDTCQSSPTLTKCYEKNADKLAPMWRTLYQVNAKYTVLVFWASDCGHCITEIPKLNDTLKTIKGKIDYKVFAVQTKDDYEVWRNQIIKHKLDFINVFDPVHINSFKDKYDVESTPVIFILDRDKKIKVKKVSVSQVVELLEIFEKIDKDQKRMN